jgi:hypothetical protein
MSMRGETHVPESALQQAYLAAEYVIPLGGRLCRFRAAAPPPELLAGWLREHGPAGWLSAFNPAGRPLPMLENLRRHQQLWHRLRSLGFGVWVGYAVDPAGDWPDETSFLVSGIELAQLNRLAQDFGQAAVLWLEAECDTRLVFCRSEGYGSAGGEGDLPAP